jgi:hypothetical protein
MTNFLFSPLRKIKILFQIKKMKTHSKAHEEPQI